MQSIRWLQLGLAVPELDFLRQRFDPVCERFIEPVVEAGTREEKRRAIVITNPAGLTDPEPGREPAEGRGLMARGGGIPSTPGVRPGHGNDWPRVIATLPTVVHGRLRLPS